MYNNIATDINTTMLADPTNHYHNIYCRAVETELLNKIVVCAYGMHDSLICWSGN